MWGRGERLVIPQSHHHSALQCQLQMWEVSEAGLHIFPQPCTTTRRCASGSPPGSPPGSQTASPTVVGSNSSHGGSSKATPKKDNKAPAADSQGLSTPPASQPSPCHSGWESVPPPQVPQEGLRWEEKEDKGHKPGREELQPQGAPLARHHADVSTPHLFNKRLCCTAHVSVITW